jgi:DNA polymerase I
MTTKRTSKKEEERTVVLLDAHAILHRAFHALPDFTAPSGEPTGALYGVVSMLLKIIEELKPTDIIACYDLPEPTYRHEAFEGYKAKRQKTDDALVAQIIRSRDIFEAFGIPIFEHKGFEADDMLGTIAHQAKGFPSLKVIIASGDMDTMQCIDKKRVQVYTLKKGIKDTILYDERAVVERFGFSPTSIPDYKGLRGDPSDNIPGIKGIGEKTATTLITHFGTIEALYTSLKKDEATLRSLGISPRIIELLREGEEEALFSKMIATIRTDAPITYSYSGAHWKDRVDTEKVVALCTELGFRTLKVRVNDLLGIAPEAYSASTQASLTPEVLAEAQVLLWLLESDRTNPSYEDIIDYGRTYQGSSDIHDIIKTLHEKLRNEGLEELYREIESPLMAVIAHMNTTGITLDTDYLRSLSERMHSELSQLETDIYTLAGSTFNINSPKQVGDILYDTLGLKPKNQKKTAGGQRSTREEELLKMKDDHEIIPKLLRYRELQKLLSTYIDNLPTMVGSDGRLRTTFLQTGAVTGRMASQNPGLQNIPVKTAEGRAIRQGFIASEGYTMVAIDYSQIELRIAAILSSDSKLIEIFKRGEDVHTGVASRVFGVKEDEVTKEMRRKAKVINFGILYGMGVTALRANLGEGTTREEAQEFLNAYFNTFTRLAEYLEETKAFARTHGYTETLFGRKRRFPGIHSSAPFIRASAERMAINAPVQGTAADIVRIAMIEVASYIASLRDTEAVRMLLQVHDELVFEVKNSEVGTHIEKIVALMEGVLTSKETYGVKLQVGVSVGKNWGELTEYKK